MAHIEQRKGKWRVRWIESPGGKRVDRSITCSSKKEAEVLCAQVVISLKQRGSFSQRVYQTTLGDAFEQYLAIKVFPEATQNTLRQKATVLDMFLSHCRGRALHVGCDALNPMRVAEFYALVMTTPGRNGTPRSRNSAAKYVSIVQTAWQWLYDVGHPGVNPPRKMRPPRDPAPRWSAPTFRDVDRLIDEQNSEVAKRASILLRFTGLRPGQVCKLEWHMFNLSDCTLRIDGSLGKTAQERRGRRVPISKHLAQLMSGWGIRYGKVIPRSRLYAHNWADAWERVIQKSNPLDARRISEAVKGQPIYCIRKTFTSELKSRGADSEAVEYLLGHSLGIREHYLDAVALPLREAIELIPTYTPRTDQRNEQPLTQIGGGILMSDGAPKRNRTDNS